MRHYLILVLAILCHVARSDVVVQKYILGDMVYTYTNQYKNGGISGRIDVINKKTGELRTRMSGLSPAGCDQSKTEIPFGIVKSSDGEQWVVLCGSDGGKSTYAYTLDSDGFITGILFLGDSWPNISFDTKHKMFYSLVGYRRRGVFSTLTSIPVVYDLFGVNNSATPIFNERSKDIYKIFYEEYKHELKNQQIPVEGIVEALISTLDPHFICNEYNRYVSKYINRSDVQKIIDFHSQNDIFPYYDISTCKEK